MRKTHLAFHLLASIVIVAASMLPVQAQIVPGEIRCRVAGGFGLIVTGQRGLSCVYYRADGVTEFYTGSSSRIGLDLGGTSAVRIGYRVSGVDPTMPAALDGAFGGPGAGVTIGAGLGADALVGGRTGSAALIPIDNTSLTGINVNAGLSVLTLHYAGMETRREHRHRY